ncbi:MAG: lytic transglycosylase domain-containing protein [Treponema sp.]|nr:lytic transglycosylase domain-containing protein [Treponema sp.]
MSLCSCNEYKNQIETFVNALENLDIGNKVEAVSQFNSLASQKFHIVTQLAKTQLEKFSEQTHLPLNDITSLVANRDYGKAVVLYDEFIEKQKINFGIDESTALALSSNEFLSDAGKLCLYGKTDFVQMAEVWHKAFYIANENNKDNCFFLLFYAGRLYDRAGEQFRDVSLQCFFDAMDFAQNDTNIDSALYYFLNISMKKSLKDVVLNIEQYYFQAKNHFWYSQFFDNLSRRLLSEKLYDEYLRIFSVIKNIDDNETVAKFAYVCGRLVEENYLLDKNLCANDFFETAFEKSYFQNYYHFVSGVKLGKNFSLQDSFLNIINLNDNKDLNSITQNIDVSKKNVNIFLKIIDKLFEKEMEQWIFTLLNENIFILSEKQFLDIKKKLSHLAKTKPMCAVYSIRLASAFVRSRTINAHSEVFKFFYPKFYSKYVLDSCKKFSIDENMIFALIRSESFFDASIRSSAGAIGLTQLLQSTANDVARKLKWSEFNLLDAHTNVLFGTYYLSEMLRRYDGNFLCAFFSYNAGINNVRNWKKTYGFLSQDLFLETLPFSETREYGRKIVSATCVYEFLYEKKSPENTLKNFF